MIFDTHSHYDDDAFAEDYDSLLQGMPAQGIPVVVNVGSSMESSRRSLELAHSYPNVLAAVGIHPDNAKDLTEEGISELKAMAADPRVVAIGEIGLDYYWDASDREIQKFWFRRQLELAREVKLPVIIHSREAAQDTYDLMRELHAEDIGGVIHCFSYSREMAEKFLDLGFFIGIGGVVTFKNSKKVKEVAAMVPDDRLVLETDCPYLAPVPFRGKRNSSLNLPYVVRELAAIRGVSEEEIERITWENAHRLYPRCTVLTAGLGNAQMSGTEGEQHG